MVFYKIPPIFEILASLRTIVSSKILSRTNLCVNQRMLDSRVLIVSPDTKSMHDPIRSMRGIKLRDFFVGQKGLTVK